MISVLFLIPTLDRGGAENVLVDLVNSMDLDRFDITVQTLFDQDSQKDRLKKEIKYKSFLYHQFRGNSRLMAMVPAKWLYKLIVRKRYDVVVSYLEGPTARVISGCPYSDSKKVMWIHSALDTMHGISAGFISAKSAIKAYRKADKVVFVAETVRKKIEELTGTSFPNSCVLYNTVNTQIIRDLSKKEITEGFFLKNEINIVSSGKITSVKGYDRLAHIQKKLIDNGYPTHIYILGKGKDRKTIEEYIQKNSIRDSFTFLGFHDNPYKYLIKADLFVCSSRREGFSTAVSEALILGIPVISTNCSGTYELLGANGEYGIITDNNEDSLLDGMKRLLDDPALLEHYKNKAKERGKMFNTEHTVSAVEDMLLSLK